MLDTELKGFDKLEGTVKPNILLLICLKDGKFLMQMDSRSLDKQFR